MRIGIGLIVFVAVVVPVDAHPVPKENHDRKIRVQLVPAEQPGDLKVSVHYRLEVDEITVVLDDMKQFRDEVDPAKFQNQPLGYYAEYLRIYGPILAKRLHGKVDGRELTFHYAKGTPSLKDDDGKDLGHLRGDLIFEAASKFPTKGTFPFEFRDGTFLLQEGDVQLTLDDAGPWFVEIVAAPDEALWKTPPTERKPGDEDRLREIKAKVNYFPTRHAPAPPPTPAPTSTPPEEAAPAVEIEEADDDHSLLRLVQSDHAFWLMLLIAAVIGAGHALTPGHGKTLVAAYLVGQRGTVWHAIALGVISTIAHTWSVLTLAVVVYLFGLSPSARAWIQASLPLILGLMIVCFGFVLLLNRLSGRADHVHIGGGHSQDHGHGHHHRHETPTDVTWGGLLLLGVTGSIVPCWDAIAMLLVSIQQDRLTWAVPILLAFSAGLAAVLVTIGILVVKVRGFADRSFGERGWVRWLPIVSAIAIIVMGFWLCRQAVTPPVG